MFVSGDLSVDLVRRHVIRGGREIGTLGGPADLANPRIAPDGKRVAVDVIDHQSGNMDIWIYPASSGVATRGPWFRSA